MTEFGLMGVDWEERVNFDRMRKERLRKAKEALDKSDVEVLLVFRHEDLRYLTGFRAHLGPVSGYFGSIGVAVLPKGRDPILYTLDMEHAKMRMPWMPHENIGPRPNIREPGGIIRWSQDVKKRIGEIKGKIGIDICTPTMIRELKEAFPQAEIVDGYEVLKEAKIIKTRDELECLRIACMVTEAGFDAGLEFLRPGVRECEVLAVIWKTMTALGSEWTQCANIVSSGPYTAPYRRYTSDRIIRKGDPVIIDVGGCYNGYWGDFTRTYICGNIKPTKEQKELHQECYDALFEACASCKPGNTNYDVWKAYQKEHQMGGLSGSHGAGLNPWEHPFPSADAKEHPTKLKPGMVINIEPYAGMPGIGGFRLENNVIVTESEPEIYSTYPFDERLLNVIHPLDKTTERTRS